MMESADDYPGVIARLAPRWRVIVCRDGLQWIIQQGKRNGPTLAWRGRSYHRQREVLLRFCAQFVSDPDPDAMRTLAALPDVLR